MKAYKVFDKNWSCQGHSFRKGNKAINTVHKFNGEIELCSLGFHFSRKLVNCFDYKAFNFENKVAEIEVLGNIVGNKEDKECTNHFKIIRELQWDEVLIKCNLGKNNTGKLNSGDRNSGDRNSGYWNSGYWNSGDWNSGDSNSGDRNSGDRNSGDRNSGDWNGCNNETGYFNSKNPDKINIFNKPCKREIWENAEKPDFIYFELCIWIIWGNMTDKEKENDKDAFIRGGYLKTYTYQEAWQNAYRKATKEDIELLKKLPNFNKKIFKEITGISIK